jgi:hypothetical protein
MTRIITYIDGFNLYFGLKSKGWKHLYWLNLSALAQNLLQPGQQLIATKYFTARISGRPAKVARQSTYIDALQTLPNFHIFLGQFLLNPRDCPKCGYSYSVPSEKMSDVNLAVQLLTDAFRDRFDRALIISADSDLAPPIEAVQALFPNKTVVVAFPPARKSKKLSQVANAYFTIGAAKLRQSLFPPHVQRADGFILQKPQEWN